MEQPLVFASGSRPERCPRGHEWVAGTYLLSWVPCDCANALPNARGHHRIRCRGDDDKCAEVWHDPPCSHLQAKGRPATGAD